MTRRGVAGLIKAILANRRKSEAAAQEVLERLIAHGPPPAAAYRLKLGAAGIVPASSSAPHQSGSILARIAAAGWVPIVGS